MKAIVLLSLSLKPVFPFLLSFISQVLNAPIIQGQSLLQLFMLYFDSFSEDIQDPLGHFPVQPDVENLLYQGVGLVGWMTG